MQKCTKTRVCREKLPCEKPCIYDRAQQREAAEQSLRSEDISPLLFEKLSCIYRSNPANLQWSI